MSKQTSSKGRSGPKKVVKKVTSVKVVKSNGNGIIGVSGYGFQYDVVLSIVLLRKLPQFKQPEIRLLRSKEDIGCCDVVLGYGGEYDPTRNRFDYHQKGFNEKYPNSKYPMTCSSMIFHHFGKAIIKSSIPFYFEKKHKPLPTQDNFGKLVCEFFYQNVLEPIDATLNGFGCFNDQPQYLMPTDGIYTTPDYCLSNETISLAVESAYKIFLTGINNAIESANFYPLTLKAAKEALSKEGDLKRILFIDARIDDSVIQKVEKQLQCEGNFLFSIRQKENGYIIFAVTKAYLCNRKNLPSPWCGKENEELEEACGEKGVEFCHHSGFMLHCTSLEIAKKLTLIAIQSKD